MQKRMKLIIGGAALAAVAALGTGVAAAGGSIGDDEERPITGEALTRAEAAALVSTGGGRVTDTEEGDEESLYEVEVTKPDGSQVDVQLDQGFRVVGSDADEDKGGDAD